MCVCYDAKAHRYTSGILGTVLLGFLLLNGMGHLKQFTVAYVGKLWRRRTASLDVLQILKGNMNACCGVMHILYANLVVLLPAIVQLVLLGGNHVYECCAFSYDREIEKSRICSCVVCGPFHISDCSARELVLWVVLLKHNGAHVQNTAHAAC